MTLEGPDSVQTVPTAIELFAGVGGFRLGLEAVGWRVNWSNQWEPGTSVQHASRCYVHHFQPAPDCSDSRAATAGIHVCDDIRTVLDAVEAGWYRIPDHHLVTAGFPCQDYSVAKAASRADGIDGKKGVLWWQIHRLVQLLVRDGRPPKYLMLENVDRLLKSPASNRGRDFSIMLASLNDLGYTVEWRVVNSADYGFSQRRRRVFIVATFDGQIKDPVDGIVSDGILAKALPAEPLGIQFKRDSDFEIRGSLKDLTERFGTSVGESPFRNSGVARNRSVWTRTVTARFDGKPLTLGDELVPETEVPAEYVVSAKQLGVWQSLKAAKRGQRYHSSGSPYLYVEGSVPFPDRVDRASRTITTGEGGRSPSRFKHVIPYGSDAYRRLLPVELERLNGFPDGWTDIGISDGRRAFLMGNALIVGLVSMIGRAIYDEVAANLQAVEAVAS